MTTTIDRLSVQMGADVSQFEEGMRLTREELKGLNRVMRQTEEPSEKLTRDIDLLEKAVNAGGEEANAYSHRLERLRKKQADLQRDTEAERKAQDQLNREMEQAKRISREVETATERYQREVGDLNRMLNKGHLSHRDYSRAMKRQKAELNQARAAAAANVPVIGNLSSSVIAGGAAFGVGAVALGGLTAGFYASVRAAEALSRAVRRSMTELDDLAKQARKLGALPEELAGLQTAADRFAGVGASQFNQSLQRMARRIGQAADGTGEATKALDDMGLSAQRLSQMNPSDAFLEISDAIKQEDNAMKQLALTQKLFDSEGVALINLLRAEREQIEGITDAAKLAGTAVDQFALAHVENANDAIADLKDQSQGLVNQLTVGLSPAIKVISEDLEAMRRVQSILGQQMMGEITIFENLGKTIAGVHGGFQDFIELYSDAADVFNVFDSKGTLGQIEELFTGPAMELDKMRGAMQRTLDDIHQAKMDLAKGNAPDQSQAMIDTEQFQQAAEELDRLKSTLDQLRGGDNVIIDGANVQQLEQAKQITEEINRLKSINAAGDQLDNMREQVRLAEMTADAVERYQRQGMSAADAQAKAAREAERYKFAMSGATEEQLRQFEVLQRQMKQQADQADDQADLKRMEDEGKRITEQFRTAGEKFRAEVGDLDRLTRVGAIDDDTAWRAAREAAAQFQEAMGRAKQMQELGRPGAAEKGSQEALQAIQGIQDKEAQDRQKQLAIEQKHLEQTKMVNQTLKELRRDSKNAPRVIGVG